MQILNICFFVIVISVLVTSQDTVTSSTNQDGIQVDVHVSVNGGEGDESGASGAPVSRRIFGPSAAALQATTPPPSSTEVTLYDYADFGGISRTYTVRRGDCIDVGSHWNDRASSLRTTSCIEIFQHIDCNGRSVRVEGPSTNRLRDVNLDNEITSFQLC